MRYFSKLGDNITAFKWDKIKNVSSLADTDIYIFLWNTDNADY